MKMIAITLIKSGIGKPYKHKEIMRCLGLKKIGHTIFREGRPEIMGMVRKIQHLVKIEAVEGKDET